MYSHVPSVSALNSTQLSSSIEFLFLASNMKSWFSCERTNCLFFTAAKLLSWVFFFLLLTPENKCRGKMKMIFIKKES